MKERIKCLPPVLEKKKTTSLWGRGLEISVPKEYLGFPRGSDGKESACGAGDLGLICGLGRSSREGNCYPLWYSCLENSMDRRAWRTTVHGVAKNWTQHLGKLIMDLLICEVITTTHCVLNT